MTGRYSAEAHSYAALCTAAGAVTDARRARTTARLLGRPSVVAVGVGVAQAYTNIADRRIAWLMARGHTPDCMDRNGFLRAHPARTTVGALGQSSQCTAEHHGSN